MSKRQKSELARVLDALDAPETVGEVARTVAHRAFTAELHIGTSIEAVAASAVYAAFRQAGATRTLDEVAAVISHDRTNLGRLYRRLADELDLEVAPVDPHEFVERYAEPLDVGNETEARAHEIVTVSVEAGLLSGVKPAGVAAGALYLAANEHHHQLPQDEVAAVADVGPVTIRHRCGEQTALLEIQSVGMITPTRSQLFDSISSADSVESDSERTRP